MLKVDFDCAQALKVGDESAKRAMEFAQRAYDRINTAVDDERIEHKFKNRTWAAEGSMEVVGRPVGEDVDCTAEFRVSYAKYLQRRGFSRFSARVESALLRIKFIEVQRLEVRG